MTTSSPHGIKLGVTHSNGDGYFTPLHVALCFKSGLPYVIFQEGAGDSVFSLPLGSFKEQFKVARPKLAILADAQYDFVHKYKNVAGVLSFGRSDSCIRVYVVSDLVELPATYEGFNVVKVVVGATGS